MIRRLTVAAAGLVCAAACSSPQPAPAPAPPPPSSSEAAAPSSATPPPPVVETSAPAPTTTTPAPPPVTTRQVEITWYGSYDNDPKGSLAIDRPASCTTCIHTTAGGTGTWADPLTFASPAGPGEYPYGLRIYVPGVRKYFVREDSCAQSWTATNGCGPVSHVDLYIGNPSGTKDVLKCEDALTPDGPAPIIVNPAADLPVDPAPLWVQATKACHTTN